MSATPPTSSGRPRIVNIAFWSWIAADVLLAAFGLLMATSSVPADQQVFIRSVGGLLVVVGVTHGFLVGRARQGNQRYAYAAVGLAMATVALLAVLLLFGASFVGILLVAVIMILMITGASLVRGKAIQAWFDSEAAG